MSRAPGEEDTEDSESIIVKRQWNTQMQYLTVIISGRSFAIGVMMRISITFMSWTKMKIHHISVLIEGQSCNFLVFYGGLCGNCGCRMR